MGTKLGFGYLFFFFSGLSDPFVQLTLMPTEAFAYETKVMKTGVKNKNSNPFFNDTFKL